MLTIFARTRRLSPQTLTHIYMSIYIYIYLYICLDEHRKVFPTFRGRQEKVPTEIVAYFRELVYFVP